MLKSGVCCHDDKRAIGVGISQEVGFVRQFVKKKQSFPINGGNSRERRVPVAVEVSDRRAERLTPVNSGGPLPNFSPLP